MMDFSQMILRLAIALALGLVVGIERELARKEAGIRTSMMVAGGASIFTLIALVLPYLIASSPEIVPEILARNGGFLLLIANIVVGVGFLGAGIIIKTEERVHGLTTAAVIWATAGIGIVVGLGLIKFAIAATIMISGVLFFERIIGISELITKKR